MASKKNTKHDDFFDDMFDGLVEDGEDGEDIADELGSVYYLDKREAQDFDAELKALKFFETTNEERAGVRYFVAEFIVARGTAACTERGTNLPATVGEGGVVSLSIGLNPGAKKSARKAAAREVARTAAVLTGTGEREYLASKLVLLKEQTLDEGAEFKGRKFEVTTTPPNDKGWRNFAIESIG